jgi:hypothetical protein
VGATKISDLSSSNINNPHRWGKELEKIRVIYKVFMDFSSVEYIF